MEAEDAAAAGLGIEQVDEVRLDAGADVEERQRSDRRREVRRQAFGILIDLRLDAAQREAGRLGFERADRLLIDVQEIVGIAVALGHLELANRDSAPGREFRLLAVLNDPSRFSQPRINLLASGLFRFKLRWYYFAVR